MASTSIHFPKGLLEEIDRRAAESGLSRNRFIVESCRSILRAGRPDWPPGFFSDDHLTSADRRDLRASADGFLATILSARRNRKSGPF